jgi:hypothetical protein
VQLDQLPADIVPLPWNGSSTGMIATGGPIGLLKGVTNRTDYQMTFSTQILKDQSYRSYWMARSAIASSGAAI